MEPGERLLKAAVTITVVSIVSKFLGLAREASLAGIFGATGFVDAYLVGETIPNLFITSVGSAVGTIFIPVFSQVRRERGIGSAFDMANSVINAAVLVGLILVTAGEVSTGFLIRLAAPGFQGPIFDLAVDMARIMFPMAVFQTLSGLLTGMLQAIGEFTVPVLASAAVNVVLIISIVTFGPRYGIVAVAVGTVIAFATQVVLHLPALYRAGYRWRPVLNLRDPWLRRVAILTIPTLVATGAAQLNGFVERSLASRLPEGSMAALNYAYRLMALVPGVLGLAIVTVVYPALAAMAADRDWARFSTGFVRAVNMINFVLVPVAVGMAVLRVPLVRFVFERGAFDSEATQATAWALLFYSLGGGVLAIREMITRAFFALQETTVPTVINIISVAVNIVLNFALVGPLLHAGLALSASLSGLFGAVALLLILRPRIRAIVGNETIAVTNSMSNLAKPTSEPEQYAVAGPPVGASRGLWFVRNRITYGADSRNRVAFSWKAILVPLWRILVASSAMGSTMWLVNSVMEVELPGDSIALQGVRLLSSVGMGVTSYALVSKVLRIGELKLVEDAALRAWHKVSRVQRT
ncbi:MAG: murein biosynthesis integral membrane protein MurJ [Limnochordales bacterium]|nr:murein biosynthesis integral membrane protein MurJ [Limnochordales bacterium]